MNVLKQKQQFKKKYMFTLKLLTYLYNIRTNAKHIHACQQPITLDRCWMTVFGQLFKITQNVKKKCLHLKLMTMLGSMLNAYTWICIMYFNCLKFWFFRMEWFEVYRQRHQRYDKTLWRYYHFGLRGNLLSWLTIVLLN